MDLYSHEVSESFSLWESKIKAYKYFKKAYKYLIYLIYIIYIYIYIYIYTHDQSVGSSCFAL